MKTNNSPSLLLDFQGSGGYFSAVLGKVGADLGCLELFWLPGSLFCTFWAMLRQVGAKMADKRGRMGELGRNIGSRWMRSTCSRISATCSGLRIAGRTRNCARAPVSAEAATMLGQAADGWRGSSSGQGPVPGPGLGLAGDAHSAVACGNMDGACQLTRADGGSDLM